MESESVSVPLFPLFTLAIVISCLALVALQAPAKHKKDFLELKAQPGFYVAPQEADTLFSAP